MAAKRRFKTIVSSKDCLYCGRFATCKDHIYGWSHTGLPDVVPACSLCNSLLGSLTTASWWDRVQILLDRYKRKAARNPVFKIPPDLGPNLQSMLKNKLKKAELYQLQVETLQGRIRLMEELGEENLERWIALFG